MTKATVCKFSFNNKNNNSTDKQLVNGNNGSNHVYIFVYAKLSILIIVAFSKYGRT